MALLYLHLSFSALRTRNMKMQVKQNPTIAVFRILMSDHMGHIQKKMTEQGVGK